MNLVNILTQNNEDRLRRARVFNLLRRATKADVGMELDPEVGTAEEKLIKVCLDMEGIPGERFADYLNDFSRIGANGIDLEDNTDGSFLVQASRMNAFMEHAFNDLSTYAPEDPAEQREYRQLFSRLYGSLYGLATEDQLHNAVELGMEGKLLNHDQILHFNYYGPGVSTSIPPSDLDVKNRADWPGRLFEIRNGSLSGSRQFQDFVDSRVITLLDADNPVVVNMYFNRKDGQGIRRKPALERGILTKILESVFMYDNDTARAIVGESFDRQRHLVKDTEKELKRIAADEHQTFTRLTSPELIAKAPQLYRILVALTNSPEDQKGEAKYVAIEAIRNFAGGLSEPSLSVVNRNYEALTEHPLLLEAYMASQSRR